MKHRILMCCAPSQVRAAALGDIDALEQLMAAGVDPGATDAPWGDTAAHAAALLDQSEALASVLDRRESPQTPSALVSQALSM